MHNWVNSILKLNPNFRFNGFFLPFLDINKMSLASHPLVQKTNWLRSNNFDHGQYFLNLVKYFLPCSNIQIWKVKYKKKRSFGL